METLSNAERITDMLKITADSWRNNPMAIIAGGGEGMFWGFFTLEATLGWEGRNCISSLLSCDFWDGNSLLECLKSMRAWVPGLAGPVALVWHLLPTSPGHQVSREP